MGEKESLMDKYYDYQAGRDKYLAALKALYSPTKDDVVLDVGTGSGTVSFFLWDKVKIIYGIDPNRDFVRRNNEKGKNLTSDTTHSSGFHGEFLAMSAEEITLHFPDSHFDVVVCWGSVHHFENLDISLTNISRVCKPGGKLIIFDAFFPEPIRDFWTFASTIHDPTTKRHYTYNEYMKNLNTKSFEPLQILPFRHHNKLDKWLSTIDAKDPSVLVAEIRQRHGGKYDEWMHKAEFRGIKVALRDSILGLDDTLKGHLFLREVEGEWEFFYDTFVLLAVRA